jgi:hypothetical protein
MAGLQSRGVTASQHETAARIARELVLLLQEARASDCQFLAYLIGMALGESRRLSRETIDYKLRAHLAPACGAGTFRDIDRCPCR